MNILSPLSNIKETRPLIEAGVDEFYAGVAFEGWEKKYGIGHSNRRTASYANFQNLEELREALEISHSYEVPIFLLMNNVGYTPDQISFLMDIVYKANNIGIDAIVVSDPGLLSSIKDQMPEIELHVSTTGATFNSQAAKFYQELGASRIVLDRQLTLKEIEILSNNVKNIKFEIFVFNWKCMYVEGLCTIIPSFKDFYTLQNRADSAPLKKIKSLLHGVDASRFKLDVSKLPSFVLRIIGRVAHLPAIKNIEPCCFLYSVSETCNHESAVKKKVEKHIYSCFQSTFLTKIRQPDCGLCAIYELHKIGINSIKIVGRVLPLQKKIKDVRLIKKVIQYIEENKGSEKEIKNKIRHLFLKEFNLKQCDPNACYYLSCYEFHDNRKPFKTLLKK